MTLEETIASDPTSGPEHGGLTPTARQAPETAVALAPGRKLVAASSTHHVFRFGMGAFLIGSALFSLQFLAWNLLGVLYGSLVNVSLILIVTAGTIAWGAFAGASDPTKDRYWDQALVRGMLAFYLMATIAILAGGGKMVNDFVQSRRVRYLVQERYGFDGTERPALDDNRTVTLVDVDDAEPAGAFAQAGIAPGQAIVVSGSLDDFYERLLAAEIESMNVTVVPAPSKQSIWPDITRTPTRLARLKLKSE